MTDYTIVPYKKRQRKTRKVSKITGLKIYSRSELEAGLWSVFSQFIRLRDKKCMMGDIFPDCQGPLQAGHVIPRGRTATRYDEMNVFGQCASHNKNHRWQPEKYEVWYINQFGGKKFMELKMKSIQPAKKMNPQELIDRTSYYAGKIEGLKAN